MVRIEGWTGDDLWRRMLPISKQDMVGAIKGLDIQSLSPWRLRYGMRLYNIRALIQPVIYLSRLPAQQHSVMGSALCRIMPEKRINCLLRY